MVLSKDKPKNAPQKIVEKQFNETDINKLFDQAITPSDNGKGENFSYRKESLTTIEKEIKLDNIKKEETITKDTKITVAEIPINNIKEEILKKNEIKRPSYQMEVEKISLCITNIDINSNKKSEEKVNEIDSYKKSIEEERSNLSTNINFIENETNGKSKDNKYYLR